MLLRVISSKHRSPSFVAAKKKITFFPAARRAPLRLVFVFNKDNDDVAKDEQRPGFLLEETLKLNRREEEDKEEEVIVSGVLFFLFVSSDFFCDVCFRGQQKLKRRATV
tara:strand:- start:161 stop:487 length:327 start_codon:yes stop_codon:yes gene_type:complete